jgi:hypothetical protein
MKVLLKNTNERENNAQNERQIFKKNLSIWK